MKRYSFIEWLVCLTILGLGIFLQTKILVTGDITWLMRVGEKFLQGGHYYTDFFEVNPPMCIYIYLIPVVASQLLHISFPTSVLIYTFLIAITSWLFCHYLLRKILIDSRSFYRINLAIALAFMYFIFPANAIGQREYLLVALIMPYLLTAVLRAKQQSLNQGLAIIAGLLAGIGFCQKPFFLFTWLFIELYLLVKSNRTSIGLRSENLALMGVLLLYAISIPILTPEYLTQVAPILNNFYYINYQFPLTLLLSQPIVALVIFLLIIRFFFCKNIQQKDLLNVLLLAMLSGLLVYLGQFTLWFYHMLPAVTFSILFGVSLASEYWQQQTGYTLKTFLVNAWICLISAIVIAINIYMYTVNFRQTKDLLNSPTFHLIQQHPGKLVFIFTDDLATNYPLLDYANAYSSSRFPCLWLMTATDKLMAIKKDSTTQQIAQTTKNFVVDATITDLIKNSPIYIFIQKSNVSYSINQKNSIAYSFTQAKHQQSINDFKVFLQKSKFQQLWKNYRYIGEVEDFYVYQKMR